MSKVLVVDHSQAVASHIGKIFADAGHEIVAMCSDGLAGAEQAKALQPDIVTLDLLLPRLQGIAMINSIKASGFSPVYVVISSVTNVKRVAAAKEAGVSYYVLKPTDDQKLAAVADRLTESQQAAG